MGEKTPFFVSRNDCVSEFLEALTIIFYRFVWIQCEARLFTLAVPSRSCKLSPSSILPNRYLIFDACLQSTSQCSDARNHTREPHPASCSQSLLGAGIDANGHGTLSAHAASPDVQPTFPAADLGIITPRAAPSGALSSSHPPFPFGWCKLQPSANGAWVITRLCPSTHRGKGTAMQTPVSFSPASTRLLVSACAGSWRGVPRKSVRSVSRLPAIAWAFLG